jgi:hypothetical protein
MVIRGAFVSLRLRSGTSPLFNRDPVSSIELFFFCTCGGCLVVEKMVGKGKCWSLGS